MTTKRTTSKRQPFAIGSTSIRAGTVGEVEFPISKLVSGTPVTLPMKVMHGKGDGPTVWVNAAIHGNEINGVEIIRRVLAGLDPSLLRGTVIAVPVVNVHGFVNRDRYFPDRRDLNRSFPGSRRGSLAARVANIFMEEVVKRCSVGIDLHTGAAHRTNLPQVRVNLDDPRAKSLATAFGTQIVMHSAIRDGSLRQAGVKAGATVMVFEGGEASRFDSAAIQAGHTGVQRVLASLDMIDLDEGMADSMPSPSYSRQSQWVRANRSGIALLWVELGSQVIKGQPIGQLHDSLGRRISQLKAPTSGIVVGMELDPIVNQGDALIHIATLETGTE